MVSVFPYTESTSAPTPVSEVFRQAVLLHPLSDGLRNVKIRAGFSEPAIANARLDAMVGAYATLAGLSKEEAERQVEAAADSYRRSLSDATVSMLANCTKQHKDDLAEYLSGEKECTDPDVVSFASAAGLSVQEALDLVWSDHLRRNPCSRGQGGMEKMRKVLSAPDEGTD